MTTTTQDTKRTVSTPRTSKHPTKPLTRPRTRLDHSSDLREGYVSYWLSQNTDLMEDA